jgi:hypothetical protein
MAGYRKKILEQISKLIALKLRWASTWVDTIFILQEVPTRIMNNPLQRNGTKDAPNDRFWEPYLKPTTALSSGRALQNRKYYICPLWFVFIFNSNK